jgi:hypothetical protein
MGIITKTLFDGKIDWPVKDSRIIVENNIGDLEAIHIHIHDPWSQQWKYRIHFTLDEFKQFSEKIIEGGKI